LSFASPTTCFDPASEKIGQAIAKLVCRLNKIYRANENLRHALLDDIRDILDTIRSKSSEKALELILNALIKKDFERARVFRIDSTGKNLRCIASASVHLGERRYEGVTFEIKKSVYADKVMSMPVEGTRGLLIDPKDTGKDDPNASALGKPPMLPFAVSLLVVRHASVGYCVCDNAISQRPITRDNLGALEVFAALAAQVVALSNPYAVKAHRNRTD